MASSTSSFTIPRSYPGQRKAFGPPVKKCMGNIGVSHRESVYPAENGDPARRFAYVACGRCEILYALKTVHRPSSWIVTSTACLEISISSNSRNVFLQFSYCTVHCKGGRRKTIESHTIYKCNTYPATHLDSTG
jgi:hypothetical protein